ncbi:hypothetical protein AAVH_02639 [Aphelenchoides avenae]|nr:hypothetical protein AAVH_02639 [Aphelenchus avenae]
MASQAATSTAETVSSQEDNVQGAHLAGFSSHAPPFFANPFMAPFLPQQLNNAAPGSVIAGSGVSSPTTSPPPAAVVGQQSPFPGLDGTEFRMNPLTGGYFLAPSQYQEMMQQYMQSLMVAAATQQRSFAPGAPGTPFDVNGLPTTQPVDPNAALSAFTGLSLCQSAQPMPSTTSQSSTPSKLSSTSSAGAAAPSPSPPIAAVQSVHLTELEQAFCATEISAGSSAQHNICKSHESGANANA